MALPPLRIAVAGLGTVGRGVCEILTQNQKLLSLRCGREVQMVAQADITERTDVPRGSARFFTNALEMIDQVEADVVVESIGGYTIAKDVVLKSLESGRHVVTANKALLALHGKELGDSAEAAGKSIAYEAAIGGGIPCVKALREGLAANNVSKVFGIMNGTCNYILTTMREEGRSFDDVLADAQAKGYAETPPDLDVDGFDTAHKVALLAGNSFRFMPSFDSVFVEGIRSITTDDIDLFGELGYKVKLLGVAESFDHGVLTRVHPALVPTSSTISAVEGVINAVGYHGDYVGQILNVGPGAGSHATASAIVADIVDLGRNNELPTFTVSNADLKDVNHLPMTEHECEFYVRLSSVSADDAQSAEESIVDVLRANAIECNEVRYIAEKSMLVVLTKKGKEGNMMKAAAAQGDSCLVVRIESV